MKWLCAILWDFDGVIADTGDLHYWSWETAFAEEGAAFDRGTFNRGFGMVNADVIPFWLGRPVGPEFIARVSERKESLFLEEARGRGTGLLLPGVKAWLARFRSMGARQAVASSAPRRNLEALVDVLEIRPFFDSIVSAENRPGKPDPWVFLEAARTIGAEPPACIVIEDSLHGIEAARTAGMTGIGVTTTHPAQALGRAHLVIDSLESLTLEALSSLGVGCLG